MLLIVYNVLPLLLWLLLNYAVALSHISWRQQCVGKAMDVICFLADQVYLP
ncbi:hypothetical protein M758_4G019500 [Ceratodon purpureus]|uniref:Uncharacterized protein n=1 Tax=Ceratodon purpureus TaxID=3225 RepID=A0A8T0I5Y6_CERPU|nr:hypothetical protein KC19_4G021700 [Ceratodon purpureus]KAG0617843.1 hypothetical protein M758_4G019500 [Ceratodon purpureus]